MYTRTRKKHTTTHFESIDPSIFAGPAGWRLIHSSAAKFVPTDENKHGFKMFIYGIRYSFPCPNCRKHFAENLTKFPIDNYMESNETLFRWSYLMHNEVNKAKGVKSPSYSTVRKFYFESLGLL